MANYGPVGVLNYPEGLPPPLREGHSYNHETTRRKGQESPDYGLDSYSTTHSALSTIAKYEFFMSSAQLQFFEVWYRDALKNGTRWFRFTTCTPMFPGGTVFTCRFVKAYTNIRADGPLNWQFSAELEIYSRPITWRT